jgi:hypothetical protein
MANSEGVAGVDSFVLIGQETAYNTEQATCVTHLGLIKSFSPRVTNSNTYQRGFKGTTTGGRNVAKAVAGKVEHSIDVEMEITDWSFFVYVLGSIVGSAPYVYTETNSPPSFTMHRCIDNPGAASTDQDSVWTGCVINNCTLKAAVGEPVSVSLNLMAADRKIDTTILTPQAMPTIEGWSFAGASIELPDSTALTNVIDSVEITFGNNFDLRPGLGSRKAQIAKARARDYKIKFSMAYLNNDTLQKALGALLPTDTTEPTENATLTCKFENGGKSIEVAFTKFVIDDYSNKEEVNEILGEDISGTAFGCAISDDRSA